MAIFTGRRIRDNNVQGTTTDNPLTNVATTLNSAGLANLSAVSSNHAVIVLDPLRASGAPEIVIVTAHTGAATSATITRGAYGTSARQHASGTLWVHAAVDADLIEILTANPSDFHEGQLWYRSDTDMYMSHDGTNAVEALPIGAWQTWTPTLANITIGNGTTTAAYTRRGRSIDYRLKIVFGSTSSMGTGPTFTLPAAPHAAYTAFGPVSNVVTILDSGTTVFYGITEWASGSTVQIFAEAAGGTYVSRAQISSSVPMTWATGDTIFVLGTYEAAS